MSTLNNETVGGPINAVTRGGERRGFWISKIESDEYFEMVRLG